uniref:Uncharacterized protein n=1 Tax=Anopheles albimanus TaxID=7167 RepID=A0A182FRG6_ANOAL
MVLGLAGPANATPGSRERSADVHLSLQSHTERTAHDRYATLRELRILRSRCRIEAGEENQQHHWAARIRRNKEQQLATAEGGKCSLAVLLLAISNSGKAGRPTAARRCRAERGCGRCPPQPQAQ